MNRILHMATAATVVLMLLGAPHAWADSSTEPPLDDLIAQAKQQGKPLVIDFYAVWCKPCKEFARDVLPKPEVKKALASVVFAKYDAERGHGLAAAKRYGVRGYPTFVVVDGAGTAQVTKIGSMDAAGFIDFVHSAKAAVLDQAGIERLVASKTSDARTLLAAARWYRARGHWKKADRVYMQSAKADAGNALGVAAEAVWECMQLRRYHSVRSKIVQQAAFFVSKYPGANEADSELMIAALTGTLSKARIENLAAGIVRANKDNAAALNGLTYSLLAAGALDAALTSAKRQVELLPKQANPLDTLAEVHHYRRERDKAIAASQRGMAMLNDPKMKAIFATNLKRFSAATFAPVDNVAASAKRVKENLARLPGFDPHATRLLKVKRARRLPSARMIALTRFIKAFRVASTTCKKRAGRFTEIYARLEFPGGEGKVHAKRVVILEPRVPRRLKRCLTKALRAAEFEDLPTAYRDRYTSKLHWKKKKKVQPWKPKKKASKKRSSKKRSSKKRLSKKPLAEKPPTTSRAK